MIHAWMALGGGKPKLLVDVEKLIWKTIFSIAQGADPLAELLKLQKILPWSDISELRETDPVASAWFDLGG